MSTPPEGPDEQIRAVLAREALGRIDALTAVIGMVAEPGDDDLAWARLATCSLHGLCAQLGHDDAGIDAFVEQMATTPDARATRTQELLARCAQVREAVTTARTAPIPERLTLPALGGAIGAEVGRIAADCGIPLGMELEIAEGGGLPSTIAGPVLDAVSLVMRHMAETGCVKGGSLRIAIRHDTDLVAISVGDRGNADSRAAADVAAAGPQLAAARSRMVAIGAEFAVTAAPWGGTSATIRVQDGSRRELIRRRG